MRYHPWSEYVFLVAFVAYVVIRGIFIERTKQNEITLRRVDGLERGVMLLVFVGNLLVPVLYLLTPWLAFADYHLPPAATWPGTLLIAFALWLFWRSHADLGLNWSVTLEVRQGHQLVDQGVYRLIRHPMYTAILLFGIAQGLQLHNWFAGWLALATFVVLIAIRTPREEQMMRETFDEKYIQYSQRTGRFLPKLKR